MQNTPLLIPWFISVTLTFLMGIYAFRFRRQLAAIPFIIMCFLATLWAATYIFELGSVSLIVKIWAVKIGYIGVIGVPLSWTAFALAYSGHGDWLTRRNILLALIFPVITLFVVFTTDIHHWFFTKLDTFVDEVSGLTLIWNPLGWWFWLHAIYIYGILVFGTYFLVREYWNKKDMYRSQVLINILAVLLPWVSNGIVIAGLMPVRIDITSVMFSVSIIILGLGFFRYGLLDIVPVAHRAVFDSLSDAVIVLDPYLRVVELNPAALELFSLKEKEVIGKPFQSTFRPYIQLDESSLKKHGYHRELIIENYGGPIFWLDLFISTLRDSSGQSGGHIVTLRDVTNIKENESALAIARDQAMQAGNFKTQLLANVSHELRTPLGVIMGYTDMLVRKSYGELNEKQVSVLGRIRDSTQYLDGLVSELLDQAQLDSGKLKLSERSFEPREVLGKTCNQLSVLAEAKRLSFSAEISEDMPISIVGDSQRLKQILVNLISNAVKFTEEGGISVKIYKSAPNEWKMQVSDTGPGISPEAMKTIFEPFKQLPEANRILRKGYGLGLSITKQLIKLMGGDVTLESEPGKGTTFTATLPLIIPVEQTQE
ncbi:MAG: PAS domain-containing protein [Anaerolineales bacterium]|nr:PAS domain-containing protein [Anaerolineales bacterium]